MQTDHGPDALDAAADDAGLSVDAVRKMILPAARLSVVGAAHSLGGSRLGGLPDLPVELAWPRWDATGYDTKQLAEAKAQAGFGDYPRRRFEELRNRGSRAPLPLSFLAQIDLADVAKLEHGLSLPRDGHLWFFYELTEQPWGYCPTHRASFRVLYAPAGTALVTREPPADLAVEHVLSGGALACQPTLTLPTDPDLAGEDRDGYFDLIDSLQNELPEHQVGGHPEQIQGDMQRCCALVTQGVYLGGPPAIPEDELDRLALGAPKWKLLLQLASDDHLDWMWGDDGNLFFWMHEDDIAAGAWDRAWLQLQCG